MSKLTPSQHATLVWLEKIGGVCVAYRNKVRCPPDKAAELQTYEFLPAVSALHLVQRGCIEARNGQFHITEYGRRVLRP